jgi:hypothetical protein
LGNWAARPTRLFRRLDEQHRHMPGLLGLDQVHDAEVARGALPDHLALDEVGLPERNRAERVTVGRTRRRWALSVDVCSLALVMHLEVKLRDGRTAQVDIPKGSSSWDGALTDFLNHRGAFGTEWIALAGNDKGEYVLYAEIVSVKIASL